jgi:23S rRNA (pseudouridine1915-N3)-methyltransferase
VGPIKTRPQKEHSQRKLNPFRKNRAGNGLDLARVAEHAQNRAAGAEERRREEAAALAARIEAG